MPLGATERQKSGLDAESAPVAMRSRLQLTLRFLRLVASGSRDASVLPRVRSIAVRTPLRKDRTMNAITPQTRIAGIVFAIVMSIAVLGATVVSMQPAQTAGGMQVIALERVVVSATAVN
jgi:uncharacterized membrane protein